MIARTVVRSFSRSHPLFRNAVSAQEAEKHSTNRALDSDDFNESTNARALWQQHLRHQQHRQWVFDDDDVDANSPIIPSHSVATSSQASSGLDEAHQRGHLYVPGASDLDPDTMINTVLSYYSPSLYAYGMFETIDIVEQMVICGLIDSTVTTSEAGAMRGETELGATVAAWFVSPAVAWRHPGLLPSLMGRSRWESTSLLLEWMLRNHDISVSPLRRASTIFCQNDLWCQFLRGMAAYGLLSSELAPFLPVVIEAAIKNNLKEHALPGDVRDRAHAVSTLLLEASVEYGSPTLLDLSLEVCSQFSIPTDFNIMLRVQQSFSKTGRRGNDWALRSSGGLAKAIPQWVRLQFPKSLHHLAASSKSDSKRITTVGLADDTISFFNDKSGQSASEAVEDAVNSNGGWSPTEIEELHRLTTQDLMNHRPPSDAPVAVDEEHKEPKTSQVSKIVSDNKGVLFTDHMAPSLYFSSSTERLGTGKALLETEVVSHRIRQGDLLRHGLDACTSSADRPIGSGDALSLPHTFNRALLDHILAQAIKREQKSIRHDSDLE
ncbi:Hypothetical protein, putative [Bodo saltans]|uniref:Uncharacterized protein n=1 Tax=Bodo saltans TaxID=75058 RepID=A0A0S4JFH8_BODSA|nr:Hypothetical protein, putative [Bodo saltans]|eukprot:CUG90346.1 Hypothetical protein, putative [Bodo saltans]